MVSLASHSKPHHPPLCTVYELKDPGNLVPKGGSTSDAVRHGLLPNLNLLGMEHFHHGVMNIFQSAEVDMLAVVELAVAHNTVAFADFADAFWWWWWWWKRSKPAWSIAEGRS
ncbi:hypothetical protein NMY22_g3592 [Coprinellus aureogranulatus]|nr:hypothetical protein NMY22_g3592 [Coprinellus aureogranulatus]